jgi:hypothetical protein
MKYVLSGSYLNEATKVLAVHILILTIVEKDFISHIY